MNDRALSTAKRKLREQMLAARRQMPHAAMVRAGESIARHFSDHPILAFEPSFAGYMAMRGELDVLPIFEQMARYHKQTSLPCLTPEKTLVFRQWALHDPLVRHPLGMQEPEASAAPAAPAVILVPLIAFDGEGYRLGYGGGYYDRTMEQLRATATPPLFIGVAYSMQEIDQVPTESHDLPLDGVLTELGVSIFR